MALEANGGEISPLTDDRQLRLEQTVHGLAQKVEQLEREVASLRGLPRLARVSASAAPPPPPPVPAAPGKLPAEAPAFAGSNRIDSVPASRSSLENRIGSQVFNRIGIVALLIGATWFLKLAVDNQWIGPLGRVLVGLLAGSTLIVWSERFRRQRFLAFSFSLKAIGSGVLYLALWAAFQLYHLLPAPAALAAMVLVTAWNAYMAWAQESEILAAYALAGGFATPLLLSTGGNHQVFLFTYLLAIDIAAVVLVSLRRWPRLLAAAFPFTVFFFIGWYAKFFTAGQAVSTDLFVLLFFAVFLVPVFNSSRTPPSSVEPPPALLDRITLLLLPFANAAFIALALYSVLQDTGHHDLVAWLMVALAAFYLALMRLPQGAATSATHLSLAVVFLTVAIPLKANGHWITASWLVEGLALLWTSTRLLALSPALARRTLRALAVAALVLGFIGTVVHLFTQSLTASPHFFSSTFATALLALAIFAGSAWLAHTAPLEAAPGIRLSSTLIAAASVIAFNLVAVLTGVVQIDSLRFSSSQSSDASLGRALAVSAFLMLYGGLLLAAGFWRRTAFIRWQALILLVFSIGKTFLYDMRSLSQGYRVLSFVGLGVLLMAVSFAYQKDWLSLRDPAAHSASEAPTE